jgi:cell division protein FtsN
MNTKQINKGSVSKNNLQQQKKNNLKPLIFTFLGTFIVFFFAFTVLLPILTPQVDIPAFTDEHSMSSVTSNDFKGRIDPRLSAIEQQENTDPPKLKMELPIKDQQQEDQAAVDQQTANQDYAMDQTQEPQNYVPGEENSGDGYYDYNTGKKVPNNINPASTQKTANKTPKPVSIANIPPRPQSSPQYNGESTKPITMAKVVLGSYATPMQARLVSDTLIEMDLNVAPFIKEKNGRYVLQVGSFSDAAKADGLVQELQSKGFNARTVYE